MGAVESCVKYRLNMQNVNTYSLLSSTKPLSLLSFRVAKFHVTIFNTRYTPLIRDYSETWFHLLNPKVRKSEGSLVRRFVSQK